MEVTRKMLEEHVGHDITVARYGNNLSLECRTCMEVITDSDLDELEER